MTIVSCGLTRLTHPSLSHLLLSLLRKEGTKDPKTNAMLNNGTLCWSRSFDEYNNFYLSYSMLYFFWRMSDYGPLNVVTVRD